MTNIFKRKKVVRIEFIDGTKYYLEYKFITDYKKDGETIHYIIPAYTPQAKDFKEIGVFKGGLDKVLKKQDKERKEYYNE